MYAINPNTIAKAYRELEEEGFIYTQSGKGTFVADANNARRSRAKHLKLLFDQVVTELFVLDTPVEELMTRMDGAKAQIFCTAVQALMSAGWTKGRNSGGLTERRPKDAF